MTTTPLFLPHKAKTPEPSPAFHILNYYKIVIKATIWR